MKRTARHPRRVTGGCLGAVASLQRVVPAPLPPPLRPYDEQRDRVGERDEPVELHVRRLPVTASSATTTRPPMMQASISVASVPCCSSPAPRRERSAARRPPPTSRRRWPGTP